MTKSEKLIALIVAIVLIAGIGSGIFFGATHVGKATWNLWFGSIQKVDDATNYETLKKVEDTCRAMIASYETDRLTWEQYKSSNDEEKVGWAEQAKMRANKTAASYNNYDIVGIGNSENGWIADINNTLFPSLKPGDYIDISSACRRFKL